MMCMTKISSRLHFPRVKRYIEEGYWNIVKTMALAYIYTARAGYRLGRRVMEWKTAAVRHYLLCTPGSGNEPQHYNQNKEY